MKLKRLLCLLLSCVMLLGILPLVQTAHAAEITNLRATIALPTPGGHPTSTGQSGDVAKYSVYKVKYYDGDTELTSSDTFVKGKTYMVFVHFRPQSGYEIPAGGTATINNLYTADYYTKFSDGYGTTVFSFNYTAREPENPGSTIQKVTLYNVQVPVVGDHLDSTYDISGESDYHKEAVKISWTKWVNEGNTAYEVGCAEGEIVKPDTTYFAHFELRSNGTKAFDNSLTAQAYTHYEGVPTEHKVVATRTKYYNDNMLVDVRLTFYACNFYPEGGIYGITHVAGKHHGMPVVGDKPWDVHDLVPASGRQDDLNNLQMWWYKHGTSDFIGVNDTFQAGQDYSLVFALFDGYTAVIQPGCIIAYYDDSTDLYFDGLLEADGYVHMTPIFEPIDTTLHEVNLNYFTKPSVGMKIGDAKTVQAETYSNYPEYEIVSQIWSSDHSSNWPDSSEFTAPDNYYCTITLKPVNGRSFANNVTVNLKDRQGNPVPLASTALQGNGNLVIRTQTYALTNTLSSVTLYDYLRPTAGYKASQCYPKLSGSAADACEITQLTWHNETDGCNLEDDDYFEAGKEYYLMLVFMAKPGYILNGDTEVVIVEKSCFDEAELFAPSYFNSRLYVTTKNAIAREQIVSTNNDRPEVIGIPHPVVGATTYYSAQTVTVPEGSNFEVAEARWVYENGDFMGDHVPLQAGQRYCMRIMLEPKDGYYFYFWQGVTMSSVKLTDIYGQPMQYMWTGALDQALHFIPGTDMLVLYTEPEYPTQLIDEVYFELDDPVAGAAPDYSPVYPTGVHYYSSNDLDAEEPGYYKNDINWDYSDVFDTFVGDTHYLYMVITADPGYTFPQDPKNIFINKNGWFIDRYSANVETIAANKLSLLINYYPGWFRCRVDFVTFDHGGWYEPVFLEAGERVTKPADPKENGWLFKGWFTDQAFTQPFDFNTPITQDVTLYAKWEEDGLPCTGGEDCPGKVFTDMPPKGNWAHDAIDWAVVYNITSGTSATTFSPSRGCTRAQAVTFLWRAAGMPEPSTSTHPFKDLNESAFYYKAVLWAVEKNITKGTSATTFSPNKTCTRGQIVTFLWRFEGSPSVGQATNPFTDVPAGKYCYDAVLWAVEQNITNGVSATLFAPDRDCTRAHIVTFLYRDLVK